MGASRGRPQSARQSWRAVIPIAHRQAPRAMPVGYTERPRNPRPTSVPIRAEVDLVGGRVQADFLGSWEQLKDLHR